MKAELTSAAAVLLLVLSSTVPAGADTIVIHGGSVDAQGQSVPVAAVPVSLVGDRGFTFNGRGLTGHWAIGAQCSGGCRPGDTVSVAAGWAGIDLTGTATLDGRTFDRVGSFGAPAGAAISFSGSLVLPAAADSTIVVTAPFLFSGLFSDHTRPASPLSSSTRYTLTGAGTVRATFVPMTNFGGRPFVWLPQRTLYEFDATTAPIPEPGTLGLLGVAAAVALRQRMRRRRN